MNSVIKIISGGQAGADRAGLDAAIVLGIEHGGYCPAGRRAEDGRIHDRYLLTETKSSRYPMRTRLNVLESDATVIFCEDTAGNGSRLTVRVCMESGKPFLLINPMDPPAGQVLEAFLLEHRPKLLNVAGSRESIFPGVSDAVYNLLVNVFERPDTQ